MPFRLRRRGASLPPLLLAALVAGQLALLRQLPYSRAWFTAVTVDEAYAPGDPLALGDLRWDPAPYAAAPSLAPLRALVASQCPARDALGTASCLSDLFAARFAQGPPGREFFATSYDPTEDLASHLAGAPGHCVTRSGLLAAALLACGFPARVVQLVPASGGGHNVAEVWDQARGWVFVDPTYRLTLDGAQGEMSAAAGLRSVDTARWRVNEAVRPIAGADKERKALFAEARILLGGNLVYPEPWLYTRVGHKHGPAPFQGRFVIVGRPTLTVGIGHRVLALGIVLSLLALAASLLARGWRRWRPDLEPARASRPDGEPASPSLI
jgi:hypothetical protein